MILLAAGVIIFLGVAGETKNIPPPENVEGGYMKNAPHEGDQTSKNSSQTVTKYD